MSLNQSRTIIRQLVAGFHNAGLQKGDCVCLHSFNDINYSIIFLGIIAAGGIFAGTNPAYTQYELAHHIRTANVRFLISEPEILPNLQAAAAECKVPKQNLWTLDALKTQKCPKGTKSWRELLHSGEKDWVRFDDLETCKTTTAARMFSSGTTGLPKAASVTHYNFIAQHELCWEGSNKRAYDVSKTLSLATLKRTLRANTSPTAHLATLNAVLSRRHRTSNPYKCTQIRLEILHHATFRIRAILPVQ